MNVPSSVLALSVLNLLLVSTGLLLVYFNWSAARRREFLYIFLTDEKPGQGYFAAARRRRAQYTRFIAAFSVLLMRQIFSVAVAASVLPYNDWTQWTEWWQAHSVPLAAVPPDLDILRPAVEFAVTLQIWLLCFEMLGLALLALGFLYGARPTRAAKYDSVILLWAGLWSAFVLLVAVHAFGDNTAHIVSQAANTVRFAVLATTVLLLWYSPRQVAAPDTPHQTSDEVAVPISSRAVAYGFAAWLVGLGLALGFHTLTLLSLGIAIAYIIFVSQIAREVLGEYEMMEGSRHRLGRERQVMFSYLQRAGAAFAHALQIEDVLRIILESALDTTEAQAGAIYLLNAQTGRLEPRVVMNFFPPLHVDSPAAHSANRTADLEREMKAQSFLPGEGVVGEVAQNLDAKLIQDVRSEGVMLGSIADYMRNRSMVLVPLRVGDSALGVMTVLNKTRGSFSLEDQSLLQSLADQSSLSINNAVLTQEVGRQERLRRELQIARDIQQRLLPKNCPLIPGFEIGARGTSATEVGGDYYDFFWVDGDRLGIVVADVSGKGVHAALIVAMIKSAFRAVASGNPDVKDVLARVNDFISEDLRRDMFVTCVYGILDIPQRQFSWARAGHEPIIVTHPSHDSDVFSPPGFALGVLPAPEFRELLEVQTVTLNPGDRLLMFTDGLTEAMNADGEEFGMQRILQVMEHPEQVDSSICDFARPNRIEAGTNAAGSVAAQVAGVSVSLPSKGEKGSKADKQAERYATVGPDHSLDPPQLQSIERAVQEHVGNAPQSDDLTFVYLAAK